MAVIKPKITPGILHAMIGQSRFGFKKPYKTQALQLNIVAIGRITDPLVPDKLSLIWSM
ncbi:MAG: hypothetical protein K0R14_435 [Burkholderiales bacterium]|nr:hypothetical protein [Burkholderiales bacterium]